MSWTASNINPTGIAGMIAGIGGTPAFYTGTQTLAADTINVALYLDTLTTVTALGETVANAARNGYNGASGQWVTGNEVATANGYTQSGIAVTPKSALVNTAGVVKFTSTGAPQWTATGAGFTANGCLVYDNTVTSKFALCWNWFGGAQTASGGGTFTINWNASGIFTVTC